MPRPLRTRSHAATLAGCVREAHTCVTACDVCGGDVRAALSPGPTRPPTCHPAPPGRGPCSGWTSPGPLSLQAALAREAVVTVAVPGHSSGWRPGAGLSGCSAFDYLHISFTS